MSVGHAWIFRAPVCACTRHSSFANGTCGASPFVQPFLLLFTIQASGERPMKFRFHCSCTLPLLISLSFGAPFAVFAQDILPSSKVLVISREYTKLGKDGPPHQAVEGAYPRALAAGKVPNHYYAAVSLSGPSRVLFFHGYASFADMAAAQKAATSDSTLSATLDRTNCGGCRSALVQGLQRVGQAGRFKSQPGFSCRLPLRGDHPVRRSSWTLPQNGKNWSRW